jgi:phosphatidylinositol alpha-1,6-mannosyltransferase
MTSEPRLLLLTPDFPPAAGGIQLLSHRIALHSRSLRPRAVTLAGPGSEASAEAGLDVRRVRRRGSRQLTVAALNLAALAEAGRFRPSVVVSMHIVTSPAAAAIKRLLSVPFVQYLHASEIADRPRLARFAVTRADATVAVSRHTEQLARDLGADPGRLHRLSPGVDLPAVRAGVRSERPTVLTVARLEERYKGHDVLTRALPLVRARVPEVEWVVVGDGSLRPHVEDLVRATGLDDCVRFTGELPDSERDRWLDRAHVLALPSRVPSNGAGGEGFGIVYLEAAAHGLPVVAGGVAGALDSVVHGETGLLVDPADHVAVADAITELLIDRERGQELGRRGRARASEFAWTDVCERIEALLLQVAARGVGA